MKNTTLSPKKSAVSLLLQLLVGAILVFLGWDLCYFIFDHKGSNWMWLVEMKFAFLILIALICMGHIIQESKTHWRWFIIAFQLLLVVMYFISRVDIRPLRALFVLVVFSGTVLSAIPIRHLVRKWRVVKV